MNSDKASALQKKYIAHSLWSIEMDFGMSTLVLRNPVENSSYFYFLPDFTNEEDKSNLSQNLITEDTIQDTDELFDSLLCYRRLKNPQFDKNCQILAKMLANSISREEYPIESMFEDTLTKLQTYSFNEITTEGEAEAFDKFLEIVFNSGFLKSNLNDRCFSIVKGNYDFGKTMLIPEFDGNSHRPAFFVSDYFAYYHSRRHDWLNLIIVTRFNECRRLRLTLSEAQTHDGVTWFDLNNSNYIKLSRHSTTPHLSYCRVSNVEVSDIITEGVDYRTLSMKECTDEGLTTSAKRQEVENLIKRDMLNYRNAGELLTTVEQRTILAFTCNGYVNFRYSFGPDSYEMWRINNASILERRETFRLAQEIERPKRETELIRQALLKKKNETMNRLLVKSEILPGNVMSDFFAEIIHDDTDAKMLDQIEHRFNTRVDQEVKRKQDEEDADRERSGVDKDEDMVGFTGERQSPSELVCRHFNRSLWNYSLEISKDTVLFERNQPDTGDFLLPDFLDEPDVSDLEQNLSRKVLFFQVFPFLELLTEFRRINRPMFKHNIPVILRRIKAITNGRGARTQLEQRYYDKLMNFNEETCAETENLTKLIKIISSVYTVEAERNKKNVRAGFFIMCGKYKPPGDDEDSDEQYIGAKYDDYFNMYFQGRNEYLYLISVSKKGIYRRVKITFGANEAPYIDKSMAIASLSKFEDIGFQVKATNSKTIKVAIEKIEVSDPIRTVKDYKEAKFTTYDIYNDSNEREFQMRIDYIQNQMDRYSEACLFLSRRKLFLEEAQFSGSFAAYQRYVGDVKFNNTDTFRDLNEAVAKQRNALRSTREAEMKTRQKSIERLNDSFQKHISVARDIRVEIKNDIDPPTAYKKDLYNTITDDLSLDSIQQNFIENQYNLLENIDPSVDVTQTKDLTDEQILALKATKYDEIERAKSKMDLLKKRQEYLDAQMDKLTQSTITEESALETATKIPQNIPVMPTPFRSASVSQSSKPESADSTSNILIWSFTGVSLFAIVCSIIIVALLYRKHRQ